MKDLEAKMEDSHFWDNPDSAKKVIDEANRLKKWTVPYQSLIQAFQNVREMLPEAIEEEDDELTNELYEELSRVEKELEELEVRKMLSGELDDKGCYLSINAGAGGTESCDWAEMLARMYTRWCSKRNWNVEIVDREAGEVAGIKSITFKVNGDFCYGYCKSEKGVHRLVRISPFDSNARRHTSFASVDVIPILDNEVPVEIRPEDLRVDTYRASGAGGQHVNKTDSAVRITHIPTGIVVSCQSERSQINNRETCMSMLKAKLYEEQVMAREKKLKEISGEKKEIAWGSQIRNYVFQPYTLVKDTRTKFENGNIQAVMDGDLDDFVHAYLKEIG